MQPRKTLLVSLQLQENESDMLPEQFSSPAREPHEEEARTLVAPHEEGQLAEASELQVAGSAKNWGTPTSVSACKCLLTVGTRGNANKCPSCICCTEPG